MPIISLFGEILDSLSCKILNWIAFVVDFTVIKTINVYRFVVF